MLRPYEQWQKTIKQAHKADFCCGLVGPYLMIFKFTQINAIVVTWSVIITGSLDFNSIT